MRHPDREFRERLCKLHLALLAKAVRLLGSPINGGALAARDAIAQLLSAAGLHFADLGELIEDCAPTERQRDKIAAEIERDLQRRRRSAAGMRARRGRKAAAP